MKFCPNIRPLAYFCILLYTSAYSCILLPNPASAFQICLIILFYYFCILLHTTAYFFMIKAEIEQVSNRSQPSFNKFYFISQSQFVIVGRGVGALVIILTNQNLNPSVGPSCLLSSHRIDPNFSQITKKQMYISLFQKK